MTLTDNSSIIFEQTLTAVSGVNSVYLTATDSFGNMVSASLNFDIFPIFDSFRSTYQNIFTSPSDLAFTGAGFSSILISQENNPSLTLVGLGFQSIVGVSGTTNSEYSKLDNIHSFASFKSLDSNNTTQALLIHGQFNGIFTEENRTIHLKRDLNSSSSEFLSYVSLGEGKDNQEHQVYRDVAKVSGNYLNLTSSSIFKKRSS